MTTSAGPHLTGGAPPSSSGPVPVLPAWPRCRASRRRP